MLQDAIGPDHLPAKKTTLFHLEQVVLKPGAEGVVRWAKTVVQTEATSHLLPHPPRDLTPSTTH